MRTHALAALAAFGILAAAGSAAASTVFHRAGHLDPFCDEFGCAPEQLNPYEWFDGPGSSRPLIVGDGSYRLSIDIDPSALQIGPDDFVGLTYRLTQFRWGETLECNAPDDCSFDYIEDPISFTGEVKVPTGHAVVDFKNAPYFNGKAFKNGIFQGTEFGEYTHVQVFVMLNPEHRRPWFDVSLVRTDPVPEPGAWALMIIGFGLTGGALRSRRGVQRRRGQAVG